MVLFTGTMLLSLELTNYKYMAGNRGLFSPICMGIKHASGRSAKGDKAM